MGYMTVEEHSATLLHLKRSPGLRSWSLLVGIASVGLAAAYYSSDSMLWKLFYVTGCLFVAMQNMEEWVVRPDVEALAALLKRFLGLEELQQRREKEEMAQYAEEEDSLDNSSDSEEEAEHL
ncbi:hypothetical protein CesoFtcFv8_021655 [Champsocephalus esox]|uniref:Essential for reactive oxygen species protein n=1 Tax=Champsocephalus esox TaxID=159716 RepID=A0AAN8B8X3_9TELE|nr:hypothetical protein CesoFtcFv8_021655 [Champsocephalus esox]